MSAKEIEPVAGDIYVDFVIDDLGPGTITFNGLLVSNDHP